MGRFLKKLPCDVCGSKDNLSVYQQDDGKLDGYCWTCEKKYYIDQEEDVVSNNTTEDFDEADEDTGIQDELPYGTHLHRKVSDEVAKQFGVRYTTASDGSRQDIHYPYYKEDGISWKIRKLPKDFRMTGGLDGVKLFGQGLFGSGGKTVVIVEGEEDALAVGEAYMNKYKKLYPVVSIPSASNLKPVAANAQWLQSFDSVILWMDNDEAGQKAKREIAKIVGYAKCKIVDAPEKDASDTLTKHGWQAIYHAIWDAAAYNPQGILNSKDLWKQMQDYSKIVSVPYPDIFKGLNEKTKGMRFGEISLFTSGTGAGKSSMMREMMMHLLENTDEKIGIISLEESPAEVARKLCAMRLMQNPSEHELPLSELEEPFKEVFGGDRVLVLDHQGAITESITDQLNYMAAVGCKYLFVDHITILVSEGAEGLTGNEATDKVMNDLLKVAKTHNVWIGLVSHLRKSDKVGKSFEQGNMPSLDDIRGSGSIKQISMDIIAFARNSEEGENTVKLKVLKCRHTGLTGPADSLTFNRMTGRMEYGGAIDDDF